MTNKTKQGFSGLTDLASDRYDLLKKRNIQEDQLRLDEQSNIQHSENKLQKRSQENINRPNSESNPKQHISNVESSKDILPKKPKLHQNGCIAILIIIFCVILYVYYDSSRTDRSYTSSNVFTRTQDTYSPQTYEQKTYTPPPVTNPNYSFYETLQCLNDIMVLYVIAFFSNDGDVFYVNFKDNYIKKCELKTHLQSNLDNALIEIYPRRVNIVKDTLLMLKIVYPGRLDYLYKAPSEEYTYDPSIVTQIQMFLNYLGYDTGKIDGIFGPKTSRAIKQFESDIGIYPTGSITLASYWLVFCAFIDDPQRAFYYLEGSKQMLATVK
ncbi:MAG: peptidoglycan-binding protein [Bacteroidales bacterium]|jgi:hypothetical protein|nr:peptidoglycan-binding protein [Bacteroidales bacterium]